jgi:hypothetical protein
LFCESLEQSMAGSAYDWKGGLKKIAREECDVVDTDGAASRTCTEKAMWAGGAKQRHASRSSASASQAASFQGPSLQRWRSHRANSLLIMWLDSS